MRTSVGLISLFIALVVGMFWFAQGPKALPLEKLAGQGVVLLPMTRSIDDFSLVGPKGLAFTRENLLGQWSFLFFGYTSCPDICPITMSVLGQAERELGEAEKFRGILISVDPHRDDPDTMQRYVKAFSPNFIGLTGKLAQIEHLANQVAIGFEASVDVNEVGHPPYVVIMDTDGNYEGFIKPTHDANKIAIIARSLITKA